MTQVKYHPKTIQNNNAAIEQVAAEDFDISTVVGANKVFKFNAHLITKKTVLAQIDYAGLDALDGVVKLQRSNNGKTGSYKDMPGLAITLDSATDSNYLEAIDFSARYIQAILIKNGVTAGTIGCNFVAKD